MAIAFIQSAAATNVASGTTIAKAYTSNLTASSYLLAFVLSNNGATAPLVSIADSAGNKWALLAFHDFGSTASKCYIFGAPNTAGAAADTVTATYAATVSLGVMGILEYSGVYTASPVDITNAAFPDSVTASYTGGPVTTLRANDVVVAIGYSALVGGAVTMGAGQTVRLNSATASVFASDQVAAAAGRTYTPSLTSASVEYALGTVALAFGPPAPIPAGNQTIIRDNFTRANTGTLGVNWTSLSDAVDVTVIGIVGNGAQCISPYNGNNASFYSAATFSSNQYAQCIVNSSQSGVNTHGGGPILRANANGYYRFFFNEALGPGCLQFAKVVNGVFNAPMSLDSTGLAVLGSLLRMEVQNNMFSCYSDGKLIFQFFDNEPLLATGAPGVTSYMSAASPTASMNSFEGGSLIWTRKGSAVIPIGATGTQEPSVIYEANPKILAANPDGNIWKMWYGIGWTVNSIGYAESNDGLTWTLYGSNPVISDGANNVGHAVTMKYQGVYYTFACTDAQIASDMNRWSSSDGITWTKTNLSVLPLGGGGAWDSGGLFNPVVWVQAGTWYMIYNGRLAVQYSMGLATSPDGINWTKYAGNPVLSTGGTAAEGKTVVIDGGTTYLWGFQSPTSNLPTDMAIWSSPDLHTWTPSPKNPIYLRVTSDEGPNLPLAGQVADPFLVELNGQTNMYYDCTDAQLVGHSHINMATAPFTLLQLTRLAFGSTAFSETDDRTFSPFPNLSHDVAGTLIDDTPAQPSDATTPVDSRAPGWKPVDSRAPANIPTNSRTPGVNGPGN